MTLDMIEAVPNRRTASAAESALPSVFDHLTDVLLTSAHHGVDASASKSKSKAAAATPKKRRSRCVWTENVEKPRHVTPKAGSKRHQRWLNVKLLMDMGFPEDEMDWSYVPVTNSSFKKVCENPQLAEKWAEFTHAPEEEQTRVLGNGQLNHRRSLDDIKTICREIDAGHVTPEKCFNRLDRRLRLLYRKAHIPRGAVEAMETEMLALFQEDPNMVLVWKLENSFFRGILHGICQYHNLRSSSQDQGGVRHTVIENPHDHFKPSPVPLHEFLATLRTETVY